MPLPLPNLDDRRWSDLLEEGRALIPRFAPAWTDHNIHDPGITLAELFAWLAEMGIYRLNQVPERHRRKFLALLGFNPRPPQPSRTMLAFTSANLSVVPAGTVFETNPGSHGAVPFRTSEDISVSNARLVGVQVDAGVGPQDQSQELRSSLPFAPFGLDPQPGAALYLGFDRTLPVGAWVSLGFRFAGEWAGDEERSRILEEARQRAELHLPPQAEMACGDEPDVPETSLPPHHSVCMVWEFYSAAGKANWDQLRPERGEIIDDTRSFTLDGIVKLKLPREMAPRTIGQVDTPQYYLRCLLATGQFDAAPRIQRIDLNTVVAEQALPAWQTLTIAPGTIVQGVPPQPGGSTRLTLSVDEKGTITALHFRPQDFDGPETHVLEYAPPGAASRFLTLDLVLLGIGDGAPGQQAVLPHAPVLMDSVKLYTLEKTKGLVWYLWERRADLDASQRKDRHYTLDPTTGQITFGNGERGQVLPPKALLMATYRTTLAERGNAPASTVTRLASVPLNRNLPAVLPMASNPMPGKGGIAAETLAEATGRAVETLWAHERLQALGDQHACETLDQIPAAEVRAIVPPTRAVNVFDIERLAREVPGTQVRRVRAWPNYHPGYPCLKVAGVVTVIIAPELPAKRPQPSDGLRGAVHCYLDRRRIVTTRIEVVGPRYLRVIVHARVQSHPGTDRERLRAAVVKALDMFLDPLDGGPDGQGWPFGRDVYRAEILQVLGRVPGVDFVTNLTLVGDQSEPSCGNLCVAPTWLVTPGQHQIEVL